MEFFRQIGLSVHDAWKARDWDEDAFPDIAATALEAAPPAKNVSLADVVRWVHTSKDIVRQSDPSQNFGDPDIRVFDGERFYIEVLCWVDGTTAIHQHSFSGAFHVMAGSSIHSRHTFRPSRRYNDYLMSGELQLEDVELLRTGQTRQIRSGNALIHALFHLERPSISVVVRTAFRETSGPQFKYCRPAIAIDPYYVTPHMRKMSQTLGLLLRIKDPTFDDVARATIRNADAHTAAHMMLSLIPSVDPYTRLRDLFESVRPAHDELVRLMLDVEQEQRRERNIILRRSQIQQPEHRFLLALLLNVPTRRRILELVRVAFPEQEPIGTIVGWLRELAAAKLAGSDESLVQRRSRRERPRHSSVHVVGRQRRGGSPAARRRVLGRGGPGDARRGARALRGVPPVAALQALARGVTTELCPAQGGRIDPSRPTTSSSPTHHRRIGIEPGPSSFASCASSSSSR